MSNKKNLPNIPIYIGDWERDCNVLSLESEAAWMRIVFKLWTKGKQNSIKMPAKSLQNLWRCSEEKMKEILQDLIYNEIAEITVNKDFVEFTCRRFVKENELSEIRSNAAKSEKKINKSEAKRKQKPSKKEQNHDIVNENVIDSVNNKKGVVEKIEIPDYSEFKQYALEKKPDVDLETLRFKYESWVENNWQTGTDKPRQIKNWKTTLLNTLPHLKTITNGKQPTINRQTRETIESNSRGWEIN